MAFDVRVGLYDDPPNKETVKIIQTTLEAFTHLGKLNRGWEGLLSKFVNTPTYWKFCQAQDTALAISQRIVENKVIELNKMADEGDKFVEDEGECRGKVNHTVVPSTPANPIWSCRPVVMYYIYRKSSTKPPPPHLFQPRLRGSLIERGGLFERGGLLI